MKDVVTAVREDHGFAFAPPLRAECEEFGSGADGGHGCGNSSVEEREVKNVEDVKEVKNP
jgi:hypothetical protein